MRILLANWKVIVPVIAALAIVVLFALWRLETGRNTALQIQVQAAQAARAMSQADASAASDAEAVVAQGAARDGRTLSVHQENTDAIDAASGSGQSLDPDLNAAGRRGLCEFAGYHDTDACVQLRGADSGQRPQAGGADGPAAG